MAVKFDVDAALAKVAELVNEHGESAVSAVESVKQINALEQLLGGSLWLGIAVIFFLLAKWLFNVAKNTQVDSYGDNEIKIVLSVGGFLFAGGLTLMSLHSALFTLFNPWIWTALFNPRLAIARDIWQSLV